jgi:hypothetical protein
MYGVKEEGFDKIHDLCQVRRLIMIELKSVFIKSSTLGCGSGGCTRRP